MKSKKFTAGVAAMVLGAGVLAACGSSDGGSSDGKNSIAFIQGVAGDQFYITMQCGIQDEAKKLGATVKAQWATLGHFDFINIVEAPDEKTMARVSLELGSRGTAHYESLAAIPIDDFIASL